MRSGGRHHLAQLVVDTARQAIGIVPELLDLGRERAGAALAQTGIQRAAHLPHRREHEAMPLDRRVLPRIIVIEQRAVFDEQQRVHDQRRNRLEGSEQMLRIARLVEGRAIAVVQREAGDFLFAIDRVAVFGGELGQFRRRRGLPDDGKIAAFQRVDEGGKLGVAEALILRAADRKADGVIRPGLNRIGERAGEAGEVQRLDERGAEFDGGSKAYDQDGRGEDHPFVGRIVHEAIEMPDACVH